MRFHRQEPYSSARWFALLPGVSLFLALLLPRCRVNTSSSDLRRVQSAPSPAPLGGVRFWRETRFVWLRSGHGPAPDRSAGYFSQL